MESAESMARTRVLAGSHDWMSGGCFFRMKHMRKKDEEAKLELCNGRTVGVASFSSRDHL